MQKLKWNGFGKGIIISGIFLISAMMWVGLIFTTKAGAECVSAIAGGGHHSIVLKTDGTVWTWGSNDSGQLGDGTTANRTAPVQESGLTGIIAISAGYSYTITLKTDGTVWTWGTNPYGQLGNGTTTNRTTPVQVSGLTGVCAIAGGDNHAIALKTEGTVWTWGRNDYGQLGDGTTTNRTTPVQVSGLTGVYAVAGGAYHSIALKTDGTVWAWGDNEYGQLGDGTTTNRTTPVQVSGVTGVNTIAGRAHHGVALKSDGTVWTWGRNEYGQLGDGTTTNRTTPVQVSGLTGVNVIAGGIYHNIAMKSDGTIRTWGRNDYGQLGDGTTTNRTTLVQVSGLTGVSAIAGGEYHSLSLKSDGTVWTWGRNFYGELGDGTTTDRHTPVEVSSLTCEDVTGCITEISGGVHHSIALKTDGTVWTWGDNTFGELGDGTITVKYAPVQVSGLTDVIAISGGGGEHSIALKTDRTVWTWGRNQFGKLGDGTTTDRYTPVQVSGLTSVNAIAGGHDYSVVLKVDGTVWAWGGNAYGQLGDGTTTDRYTPVQVSGLTGVSSIAGGGYVIIALKSDGTVWTWGRNFYGELGDGTTTDRHTPVQVSGLTGVSAIAGGGEHGIALKSDGTVWTWGGNDQGQLGDGTNTNRYTPVQVSGLTGVSAIAGGGAHSIILKSDGTVWAWGYNLYGQLGDGTTTNRTSPVQVSGLTGVSSIAGGNYHVMALKSDGTVWAWGRNNGKNAGTIGDGTTTDRHTPVQVSGITCYTDTTPPSAPGNLSGTGGDTVVNLDWQDNTETDLAYYNVYRSTTSGSGYSKIAGNLTVSNYQDTGRTNGTTYYYKVTAVDTAGNESSYSNEVSVTPSVNLPPATPTGLTATAGNQVVNLNWNDNTESDLADYNVFRSLTSGSSYSQINTATVIYSQYQDSGLTNGTTYYYVVSAVDTAGNESGYSSQVSARPMSNPPTASASATPASGTAPLTVSFTGTGTDDGSITKYEWDFDGNGVYDWSSNTGGNTVKTYSSAGTYTATLRVTDNDNLTGTASVTITVTSPPEKKSPVASISVTPTSGIVPLAVTFTYSGTDSDGTIQKYEIDFDSDGTYDWSSTASGTTTKTYSTAGTYTATLKVTDNDNLTGNASVVITVSSPPADKKPPTASLSVTPTSGTAPLTVTFTYSGTDTDGTIQKYEIDFNGDGTYDWSSTTSGTTTKTYSSGTWTATLKITDNDNLTATASVTITGTDKEPPTALLSATPTSGTAPLTVTFTYSGTDTDGTIQKYEIDFDGNGSWDYTAASSGTKNNSYGQAGSYTATLKVTDNDGLSGTATVSITIENPTGNPLIADANCNPTSVTVGESVTLTGTATGGSGSYIVYIWDYEGDGEYDWTSTATGTTFHTYDEAGSYSPTVMVVDSGGLTDTDSASLTVNSPTNLKVWISVPKNGDSIWGTDVTLHANTAPGNLTKSVQFQYKGATTDWTDIGNEMFPPPNSFFAVTWDVTGLTEGDYQLRAVGKEDTSDNIVNSEIITITVTQTDPDIEDGEDENGNREKKQKISKDETTESSMEDNTSVEIPYGTLTQDATLTVTALSTNPQDTTEGANASLDNFRQIELEGNPTLEKSVTITVPYADTDNDGVVDGTNIPEKDLKLWWFNTTTNKWEKIADTEVDTTNKKAKAKVGHLSDFAIGSEDTAAPSAPSGLTATAGDGQVSLTWTNPTDTDFAGVKVIRKTGGYPASVTDGTEVYSGTGTSATDTGLTNGTACYYTVFAYDEVPNYSTGAQATATPQAAGGGSGGGGGGGCFIATAAYGTPMAGEVIALSQYRDTHLLTNPVGRRLVAFYYRISPPIADFIAEHECLRSMVRFILKPVVRLVDKK